MAGVIDAGELLGAVRDWVAGLELADAQAFEAKVAANALAIVARELAARPAEAEAEALAPWGGVAGACAALRDGRLPPDDPALLRAAAVAAVARLAVDNPRYATLPRLRALLEA